MLCIALGSLAISGSDVYVLMGVIFPIFEKANRTLSEEQRQVINTLHKRTLLVQAFTALFAIIMLAGLLAYPALVPSICIALPVIVGILASGFNAVSAYLRKDDPPATSPA